MRTRNRIVSALALFGCLAAAGQAAAQPYGYAPIPPPQYEAPPPPPPPGERLVWQGGGWEWNGAAYVWRRGHYVAWRPHYGRWIPGHWDTRSPRPFWVPAHWR